MVSSLVLQGMLSSANSSVKRWETASWLHRMLKLATISYGFVSYFRNAVNTLQTGRPFRPRGSQELGTTAMGAGPCSTAPGRGQKGHASRGAEPSLGRRVEVELGLPISLVCAISCESPFRGPIRSGPELELSAVPP